MIHKDIKIAVRLHRAKTRGQSVCGGGEGGRLSQVDNMSRMSQVSRIFIRVRLGCS